MLLIAVSPQLIDNIRDRRKEDTVKLNNADDAQLHSTKVYILKKIKRI